MAKVFLQDYLRDYQGMVWVVALEPHESRPEVRRLWYPTEIKSRNLREFYGEFDGERVTPDRVRDGAGVYNLPIHSNSYRSEPVGVKLVNGGRTVARLIDVVEVAPPPPLSKRSKNYEVYWDCGEWRIRPTIYLKSAKPEQTYSEVDYRMYALMPGDPQPPHSR